MFPAMEPFSFFWHDYETFGVVPRRDRPAQFAGLRTDADLHEIGEPLTLYCQPAPDTLPDPESCLLTGITPRVRHSCGVMPVRRQLSGSGSVSGAGWQYKVTGSPISFRSASVRRPANCAGRSRRGTTPKVS